MVSAERHMKAMDKVHSLVSVRERSEREVAERLAKSGFSEEEARDAAETAVRVGLVSDERYARAFIRGKTHRGWGREKIVMRLKASGVDGSVIESCSDAFASPEEEFENALAVLRKLRSRSSDPYASYVRRLVGRGFSYGTARRAARERVAEETVPL